MQGKCNLKNFKKKLSLHFKNIFVENILSFLWQKVDRPGFALG